MTLSAKLRRAPLRAVTGAYILNSGVGKLSADDQTSQALHGMASGTYPFLGKVQPKMFSKGLAVGEITVGTVLLLPVVSPVVAGAALAGFSGALLKLYWNTPGMHEDGSPRPTQQGIAVSKDVWMLGIGAGLIADGVLEPAHDKRVEVTATVSEKRAEKTRRAKRKAAKASGKAAKKAAKRDNDRLKQMRSSAGRLQAEAAKRASKAAKKAQKRAEKAGPVAAEKAKQAKVAAQEVGAKARERIAS
jgi:uncharacterized membrane protein YphA (DoxX/SURF4 family)